MKTIIEALKFQFYIQILFGLSPLLMHKNQLKASRAVDTYMIFWLLVYPVLIFVLTYNTWRDLYQVFSSAGYLWLMISTFELVFTNILFPLLVLHSFRWRHSEMNFWLRIVAIDTTLQTQFSLNMRPTYRQLRNRMVAVLLPTYVYYWVISIWILVQLILTKDALEMFTAMFLVFYAMEQCLTGVYATKVLNEFLILRTLFGRLKIVPWLLTGAHCRNQPELKQQLVWWTIAFKEICALIDLLNRRNGTVLLFRFAHDFTLLTTQCYMIYLAYVEFHGTDRYLVISMIVYWMGPNVMKMGFVAWGAQITVFQV